ncbi:MAG: hypothetical protein KGP08_08895 [Xanthomonadaceae bacterium]|nr:hypothetical protein [Xanthomonadaceae bacterium]
MPTTFTIKQVPDALADRLRRRASDNRRSLQKELQSIMEDAVEWEAIAQSSPARVAEPPAPAYLPTTTHKDARLSLDQAWERARKPGASSPSATAAIARDDELLEKACTVIGNGERSVVLREGLKALIEREAARRLIQLGGSVPGARRPPRRRSEPIRKRRGGA